MTLRLTLWLKKVSQGAQDGWKSFSAAASSAAEYASEQINGMYTVCLCVREEVIDVC